MRILIVLIIVFFLINIEGYSQRTIDTAIAVEVSNRLKDSLRLTDTKSNELYKIELMIREEKRKIREQYRNTPQLHPLMHEQDLRRDSLYRIAIGEEKYKIYQKKPGAFSGSR